MDETSIDNPDTYDYGWSEKETNFFGLKKGKKSVEVSIIAVLS
ncbi:hypothetical protein [Chroococcidiopsis sp. CCNUC1]|nr:hypothetical protein [Chroococcidiopsis sp. CCNUC1]